MPVFVAFPVFFLAAVAIVSPFGSGTGFAVSVEVAWLDPTSFEQCVVSFS
ncbi:hypothetical protein ABZV58_29810 [Nocardia sp. NPDC004654]